MCMLSGWCEKKSAIRQFSWMWFFGLGLSACTMSGNLMPSRTKNTCPGDKHGQTYTDSLQLAAAQSSHRGATYS